MLKPLILFHFLALGILPTIMASQPDWSVNPAGFKGNMTITGVINFDGTESADTNDLVGVFSGTDCRGVGSPVYVSETDRWMVFLLIYGNESFDTLSFRIYDASTDEVFDIERELVFEMNGIIGEPNSPYIWSYPVLSSGASFYEFTLEGQIQQTVFTDTLIRIFMPSGTDLTALIATFIADTGSYVSVDGTIQVSGVTVNDFSEPVVYTVVSPDGFTASYYTVKVMIERDVEAANFFSPNGDMINDTWIVQDPEIYENCEFVVYDAAGNRVLEQTGYNNDWDGKYKGNELPDGTYYFIIRCADSNVSYTGSITLLR